MAVEITCINKDGGNHTNPYLAISHLGWWNGATGERGKCTRVEMYEFIKNKNGSAYVTDPRDNSKVYLEALVTVNGTQYVRTIPNDTGRDNLLSLDECR